MKHLLLSLSGILTLALALCLPAQGQSAQDLLQQGSRLEQVEGDYEGAIAVYRQIAENQSADRRLVARALLQMGKAYEVLGRDGARDAYTRIVNEYGDFAAVAGEAAERIAAFRRLDSVAPIRTWAPGSTEVIALSQRTRRWEGLWRSAMSPDGKYIAREAGRQLVLQHIASGRVDSLTAVRERCNGYWTVRFSPTGDRIAFGCWLENGIGVAVLDLASRQVDIILDGSQYFETTSEDGLELYIYDWSDDGSAVLAHVEKYQRGDSTRSAEHLLLIPHGDGSPTLIDTDLHETGFAETQACLLQDGRFMFGTYGWEPSSIQSINTTTMQRAVVLSDDLANVSLYDCLPESNTILYSRKTLMNDEALLAAPIGPDGSVGSPRFVANLPEGSKPVPGARDGNVYYSDEGGTGPFFFVADVDTLRGGALSNIRDIEDGVVLQLAWSPDGTHLISTRGRRAFIGGANGSTKTQWQADEVLGRLIWSPDGKHFMSSHPPEPSPWYDHATVVHERDSGEITHQVADLAAVAWIPNATGFYHVDSDGRCLSTYIFASQITEEVMCLDPGTVSGTKNRFQWARSPGWVLSPDGSAFAIWDNGERLEGEDRPIFLLDTGTWELEQLAGSLDAPFSQVSWSGDSRHLMSYAQGKGTLRVYDLARQAWSDWPLGELAEMRAAYISFHPSGTMVAVAGQLAPKSAEINLSILHQPPGLLEAK